MPEFLRPEMHGREVRTGVWWEPRRRYWRPNAVVARCVCVCILLGTIGGGVRPSGSHEPADGRRGTHVASVVDEVMVSQLAVQTVPRVVRRGTACVRVSDGRLQGRARVHRRIHLPVDEIGRSQPDSERRAVSQTYRRVGLVSAVPRAVSQITITTE